MSEIKAMVRGCYDLQMLRMQMGLRLAANFRAKLGLTEEAESEDAEAKKKEAEKIIDRLKAEYGKLTEGLARRREIPRREDFVGEELISTYAELVLYHQFEQMKKEEERQFKLLGELIEEVPIWQHYLKDQRGIGPPMAGVLITTLDPHKARYISSFWKFAGLDLGPDGSGRSRRQEHLVERKYIDRNGNEATRMGVTYDPWLKTKLFVLASSFMRLGSPWVEVYRGYKHRLETDPAREKCTVVEWKKRRKAGEDVKHLWTPERIDTASKRYMVKAFLADLWVNWRRLEGLPITEPYAVAKLGRPPHSQAAE
jgi:hypothetical protein